MWDQKGYAGHCVCSCEGVYESNQRCNCASRSDDLSGLAVMFCPHQPSRITRTSNEALQVVVPRGVRTGPIAIVRQKPDFTTLVNLINQYSILYQAQLDFSVLSAVSMDTWAYPEAFCRPIVQIHEPPITKLSQPAAASRAGAPLSTNKALASSGKPSVGPAPASDLGYWDAVLENALGIVGVHAVVLRTGKVLYWSFDSRAVNIMISGPDTFQELFSDPNLGSYQIWDPSTQTAGPIKPLGRNSFCAGQCALEDGTILVVGGQDGNGALDVGSWWTGIDRLGKRLEDLLANTDNGAHKNVRSYDPIADTWTNWPELNDGRYYPSCCILNDGTAFIAGGLSNLMAWTDFGSNFTQNNQFELIRAGELLAGPTAPQKFKSADQYPIMQQLPGSRHLFVHIETTTSLFDLDSSSFIADFAMPLFDANGQHVGRQTYPMQSGHVLLPLKEGDQPRIMIAGGSTSDHFDTNTQQDKPALLGAFIFEYNAGTPASSTWRLTKNPPTVARLLADTVLLPDGTVFIVNGIKAGAAAGHSQATVFNAEIFDPTVEQFSAAPLAESTHPRAYHSTAVLLPDGRVAIAGNTMAYNPGEGVAKDDTSIQVYNPPYLSAGPRPAVTGVPNTVGYGSQINADTSGGPVVSRVMMMRPCAVTHSVDMDQRAIWLASKGGAGSIAVNIPNDRALAPPGYYMLFFLSGLGVPSVATFILLKDRDPTYPEWDLGTYSGDMVVDETFDGNWSKSTSTPK